MFNFFRRSAPWVNLAGIVVLLIGLSLDAVLHGVNPEAAHQGGILSLLNPAHSVPAAGITLCVVSALLWLLGSAGESGIPFPRRTAFVSTAGMLSLLAFVSLVLSASVLVRGEDDHNPSHAGAVGGQDTSLTRIVASTEGGSGQDAGHNHGGNHDHGDQASATAAEQKAAAELVGDTEAGASRFENLEVAQAEGYEQMRGKRGKEPGPSRPLHFINKVYVEDGELLDPERPEALVYTKTRDGEMALIGVMYVAPRGEGPTDAGGLTHWHTHDNLCVDYGEGTGVVVTLRRPGGCLEGSSPVSEIEMMHVWLFDHPDGPLAPHMKPKDASELRNAEL